MKKSNIFIAVFFLSISLIAQKNVYEFHSNNTKVRMKKNNNFPMIYSVMNTSFEIKKRAKARKVISQEYKNLNVEIESVVKDSISSGLKYQKSTEKLEALKKINTLISEYIGSSKPYELKVNKLVAAQKMADTYNLNQFIYADENLHPEKKAKFFILKLNSLDLKVHLKKITWELDKKVKNFKQAPKDQEADSKLKMLREKLKKTSKYQYIKQPFKVHVEEGLALDSSISDPTIIVGVFEKVKDCYVLNKTYGIYQKGRIVSVDEAVKGKVPNNYFVDGSLKKLISDVDSDKMYVVENDFLNKYALKINGKYNYKSTIKKVVKNKTTAVSYYR